jgi:hypothetical protein
VYRFITYVGIRYESVHFLPPKNKLAHSNTFSCHLILLLRRVSRKISPCINSLLHSVNIFTREYTQCTAGYTFCFVVVVVVVRGGGRPLIKLPTGKLISTWAQLDPNDII